MPFCSRCGAWYTDEDTICSTCGSVLTHSAQPIRPASTQPEDPYLSSMPQPTDIPPVQAAWDPFSQPVWETPVQPTWEAPVQPGWDASAQPSWETPAPPAWEAPAQSIKAEPGQPKTAFLLGIIATLALLLVLLIGVFAADYFTDREVNLFGLLGQEHNLKSAPSDTTATTLGEETVPPMPTEPMPTGTETTPEETLPEETLPQDTLPAVTEPIQMSLPVQGRIATYYAIDCLTYNPTTRDWRIHDGLDIAAEAGTPVRAVADGTVYSVYQDDTMGYTVVINHPDGYTTIYSSLAEGISVHQGDAVQKGQTIGLVGNSALLESAIGSHVHFSAQYRGLSVDPNDFLTTIDLSHNEAALTEVMDGKLQLMTDSQSVMYLSEYLNVLEVNEIDWWEFVDFDQDGYSEVYAVTDSPIHSYLVLHWNGTQVCAFSFGARSMQTLKTNGWFSASSSTSESYFFRITFQGNSFTEHTLASFDTLSQIYQIDGKAVSKAEADQFLAQWSELPEVTRPGSVPPEETDPLARCAYCGVWHPLSQMKDGLCSECQGQAFQCQICRKWSTTVFEGYCEECDPAQWGQCPSCGVSLGYGEYDNDYGMCDSCLQNGGKCSVCGKLTGYLDSGICSSCQQPVNTAACVYCGTETSIDLLQNDLCEECWYWRGVGWCSVCGNLAYEIYDGVCTDCAPVDGADDPEEYTSQCTVCGEWSDTVFENICDNCGGYDGRG